MRYNMYVLEKMVLKVYEGNPIVYDIDDTLRIFYLYFRHYQQYRGCVHPNINQEQVAAIVEAMPFVDKDDKDFELDVEAYPEMILKHFKTRYSSYGCDYNINHFFSGDVRLNRFYETQYRENESDRELDERYQW